MRTLLFIIRNSNKVLDSIGRGLGFIFGLYKQYIHESLQKILPSGLHKYLAPIEILGIAAATVFVFGRIFDRLTKDVVERGDASVLEQAIPFASTFISIILIYVLLIFMVALRYNGKIPYRTHRPIELTSIAGIGAGVFAIFQPWEIVSYKYGFLLLLGSTIMFILWSHVTPESKKRGESLPPFNILHHIIGLVGAIVVIGAIVLLALGTIDEPAEPYGYTDRIWNRGLREEQRVAIAESAQHDYDYTRLSIGLISLLPGLVGYFITREVAVGLVSTPSYPMPAQPNIAKTEP